MIVGIDIGTSNIKIIWLENGSVTRSISLNHNSQIKDLPHGQAEQDPNGIINGIMDALKKNRIDDVVGVAVCGQMHGILCWNENLEPVTNLVTWEDSRVTKAECEKIASSLYPGYGVATLAWWRKYQPDLLHSAVSCGTIMDYCVALLTNNVHNPMSPHTAHSFGCWSTSDGWRVHDDLLPSVNHNFESLSVNHILFNGRCKTIPAMGDHQCSLFATGVPVSDKTLFYNFGTSAQMAFISNNVTNITESGSVEIRPFYDGFGSIVSIASMNGGNVINHFVSLFNRTHDEILSEIDGTNTIKSPVWKSVRLFPERSQKGDMKGVRIEDVTQHHSAAELIDSLARGLVENLFELLYDENKECKEYIEGIDHCVITGGARKYVTKHLNALSHIKHVDYVDQNAAVGAALFYNFLFHSD